MKNNHFLILVIILTIIPLIYAGVVYNALPQTVATHFSFDGKPDGYSSKTTFLLIVAFLSAMCIGMYLLLNNIQHLDPKKAANQSKEAMQKMALAIVALFTVINIIIIYSAVNNGFVLTKILFPVLGLFFACLGNLMFSIKPNYFVGIRTPWTLEDADTWRKTHQLAGKLWFAGGLLITITTLLISAQYAFTVMMIITGIITLVPVVYSYRYFQLHRKGSME